MNMGSSVINAGIDTGRKSITSWDVGCRSNSPRAAQALELSICTSCGSLLSNLKAGQEVLPTLASGKIAIDRETWLTTIEIADPIHYRCI
jgi:hypothetical protein